MKKIVAVSLIAMMWLCGCTVTETSSQASDSPSTATSPTVSDAKKPDDSADATPPESALEKFDAELSSGNYTAGIDIPGGKYDFLVVSGGGNVYSSNGSINAVMGEDDGSGIYQQEYKNISLSDKAVLYVSGVTIRATCEKPKSGISPREQPNTETVSLGNGNFVSGEDFPAGVYNVVATSGGGNVYSDNLTGGLNAIMGVDDGSGMYELEYKNVDLPEGTTLSIDGVQINLVPSK